MKIQKILNKGVHVATGVLDNEKPLVIISHEYLLLNVLLNSNLYQSNVFDFNDVGVSDCCIKQENFVLFAISKDIIAKDNNNLINYCNFLLEDTNKEIISTDKHSVALTKEIIEDIIFEEDLIFEKNLFFKPS